jgi:hypothetical protein
MRRQARPAAAAAAVALAALLAACGGPPPPTGPAPAPVDAGVDAAPDAPPDPDHAALLAALTGFRDRACACADAACAEQVEVDQVQWGFDHKPLLDRVRPTPEQNRALHAISEETEGCIHRLSGE